jgi:hypothetical protein
MDKVELSYQSSQFGDEIEKLLRQNIETMVEIA